MKKLHVSAISILFAALCLAFTACNQGVTAGNGTGTVRVVIGGEPARSVDAAGLPVFDDTNTKITVTGKDGTQLAEGTTSVTLKLDIGTKITVKAVVTTLTGEWRGSAEHTVTAGTNTVAVKLSKAPKDVASLMFSITGTDPSGSNTVSLSTKTGKKLLDGILISSTKPVTARDSIGRIYVLYDKGSTKRFTRFDVEGNEDPGFETAITSRLPPAGSSTSPAMTTMTVDPKTNTIFVVNRAKHVYAIKETGPNTFTHSNGYDLNGFSGSADDITAVAAYNGTLFFTVPPPPASGAAIGKNRLIAVKAELSDSSLTLSNKIEMELPKLRTDGAFSRYLTNCTGLFADESGVYCLLSEQNLDSGTLYTLGQIVRYQYSGSAFTGETKIGLNPKAAGTDDLPFDAQYFSAPVGFIGYDEENLYIADDGVGIQYVNENYHVNGNKNRIAAFNRKTNEITFTDTDATWYGQKPEYKYPNTKILLWGKNSDGHGFDYYQVASAEDSLPAQAFGVGGYPVQADHHLTDVFCYDQDGNLYIVRYRTANHCICRFELKADGSYNQEPAIMTNNLPSNPTAIAVDISDGKNYLYYADTNSSPHTVKRFKWGHSGHESFTSAEDDSAYTITLSSGKVTALAANKDGVFVATKEQSTSDDPYTLKIKKYKKDGSPNGEKTIAYNEGGDYNSSGDYTKDDGTIYGLQVIDGELYALRHNIKEKIIYVMGNHRSDEFRSSGVIYKVGNTDGSLSDTAMSELGKKEADDASRTGYGFYRFIAVKPKKLIIASDGAWGMEGTDPSSQKYQNTDKVLEYDLAGQLQSENNAGGSFSKQLTHGTCDFEWK